MNERDYLDHLGRVKADAVPATIESRNEDGTYQVRLVSSRAIRRASPSNPGDTFKAGQRVHISEPSASRTVIGSEAIIQTRAPKDQRGLSETTPAESRASSESVMIISVDPDPLILVAGGESAEQTIIGRGFTSAAEYVAMGSGETPLYSEPSAPTITPTIIVMTLAADADSPLGGFTVMVGQTGARDALRIVAPGPLMPPYLVVSGEILPEDWPTSPAHAALWILHPTTLALLAQFEIEEERSGGLFAIGGVIYWLTYTGFFSGDDRVLTLRTFNPTTESGTAIGMTFPTSIRLNHPQVLYLDDKVMFPATGGANTGLWTFDLDGTGEVQEYVGTVGSNISGLCATDDALFIVGTTGGAYRIDRATFAEEETEATALGSRVIAIRSWSAGNYGAFTGELCVTGGTHVRWLDSADLSVSASFTEASAQFRGPVQIDDKIYFFNHQNGKLYQAALDGSSVTHVGTSGGTISPIGAFNTDGVAVYVETSAQTVRRIGVDGELLATSPTLESTTYPTGTVDLLQTLYVAG